MKKVLTRKLTGFLLVGILLSSCSAEQTTTNNDNAESSSAPQTGESFLRLTANGEDFVREGFVTKDGWSIDFDNVYVTINNVTAYQTEPPFNAESEDELQATESVTLVSSPTAIDLKLVNESNPTVLVTEVPAPPGTYNALSWEIYNEPDNPEALILKGKATKDGETVGFSLSFPVNISYSCGEFVGDDRKGILEENSTAELEMTFHFDHIFGDAELDAEDELNRGALGFAPMAQLAKDGTLEVNLEQLQRSLTPEEYEKLDKSVLSLGHVGEGHCRMDNK
ncbi:MAG: DUF4382 domain-containing protein [Cyanobacterium sp. T60_A2020_053]|nr:DUF4382 domain-containing protein [Cyanobacterium sp. T60_A2020_053]